MRQLLPLALTLAGLFCIPIALSAQSVAEMERSLQRSQSKSEKMNLSYQIAEKSIGSNPSKATDYAHRASLLASELGEKRREAEAIALSAEGLFRQRKLKESADRYNWAWNVARNYGLRDLVISDIEKLQEIARKQNDLREELKWSRELVTYLKENTGRGAVGGDAQRRIEAQLATAEADNRRLREELARITGQTQNLENISKQQETQLKAVQEQTQVELAKKDQELTQLAQQKIQTDQRLQNQSIQLRQLTTEQLADSVVLAQQREQLQAQKALLAEKELIEERNANIRNLMALIAGFVLILAFLFYIRYRAQRRMARELSEKNTEIAAEQKKSDELLLNILPPAIAQELKSKNKVAAQKYEKATVMFIDFTGFTHVAERLTPEALVQELDYCFSNFDRIISKYRIEKIKTVGDAYICASGLSDMNASPSDMIKAALEIQDFLLYLKAERQSQALPYFEARCGIHTGPVVAGVVGAKKFAYDIWGDTVNIAARMEETCEAGRVNVSEDAYWLAKYDFEWLQRGKVAAKNKGQMDMYYVTAVKTGY